MVSAERGLPASFDPASGKGIKWSAQLGTETHSTPVIAGGRIFVGTNNGHPRDSNQIGDRGVLMCFDEQTGHFLWQLVVPKREEDVYFDWPNSGISSPVTVEENRVYLVSNRGEVLCLAEAGKAGEAEILWRFNLTTGAGIWSHDAAHSSILIQGDLLYLNTGTGVDNTHKRIRDPKSPSLVVLDKRDGHLVAREMENIASNIFHSTWSAPSLGRINGRDLLFFAAGNGIVYAFDPAQSRDREGAPSRLHRVWQFDFDPTAPKINVHKYNSNRRESPSNFYGMPVFYENRLYVAGGGDLWWGKNEAWLKCINPTGTGDITTNGLIWAYPLNKHVLGTPAISNGLAFIADCGRTFHCVDAKTGAPCWTESIEGEAWASPLVADGKVYLGTRSGAFYIFAVAREKKLLSKVNLGKPISSTAVAANGVLYVSTMDRVYAITR
ncbi:MAG: pyrrolo-quinoline quinone [Verrucomicrobia bacterium]|nr:MAG: pyrrolo-quinoline quinone [Verrucomicrobiota bacterium]